MRFSTLRFLRISVQRTRRRKYVEDLSLLLVRVASPAPDRRRPGPPRALEPGLRSGAADGPAAIAVVLDNSASMAVTDAGRPRFETARQGVEQVLARLRPGDQVALLPTCGPPGPELGRLFRTHETVRQALDQCRPSYERADLAAKLQQAAALLAEAEVHGQGDLRLHRQPGPLLGGPQGTAARETRPGNAEPHRPQLPLILVNVDREPAPNVALQSITLDSPAPVAGASFQAAVEVLNTAAVPQQKHLELHVDGTREKRSARRLSLSSGGHWSSMTFRFTLDRAGVHRGEVRLAEDDGSALDNRLYFAVTVDQQVPVAIVKPRQDEVPQADDAFYLDRALAPGGIRRRGLPGHDPGPGVARRAADLSDHGRDLLRQPPGPVSPPAAEKLLAYAHDPAATSSGSAARTSSRWPTTP